MPFQQPFKYVFVTAEKFQGPDKFIIYKDFMSDKPIGETAFYTNMHPVTLEDATKMVQETMKQVGQPFKVVNAVYGKNNGHAVQNLGTNWTARPMSNCIVVQIEAIPQQGPKVSGGSKRKIHTGSRGGKYYIKNGKKIYI